MGASPCRLVLRWAAAAILLTGASFLPVPDAAAQLYSIAHRPTDAGYYRFQTPHFQLIFQGGLYHEALETADVLERVYPEVQAAVGLRRSLDVPVILNHYTDQANGFVSPWPFRQEIEAVNLRGKALSPRFPSWFETVGPHELAHAAHAESGHGFGVGWILRQIGPDLARSLNLSGPRGMNEGVAVWVESRLHPGAGRLNYSLFEMQFRAAMASGDPWSLVQMLEPPAYTRPFDRYYNGGAHVFEYLAGSQGIEFFHRTRNFYYRFPLLGYAPALWYGTGMMPHVLSGRLRRHYRARAVEFEDSLGETTKADLVASLDGTSFRRPRWLDDQTIVVYASGYALRPGFYRIDVETGRREVIAYEAITEDAYFSLSAHQTSLLFSRYVPSTFAPAKSTAEVFRLDAASGEVERLTEGGRAFGAVSAADGSVWMLTNGTQFNEWRRADEVEKRVAALVGAVERTILIALEPSPVGERVAVVANHDGRQGLYDAVLQNGELVRLEPWLVPAEASVFDASWSPDGRHIVFSADPHGVSNIYAMDAASGRISKLTNVTFGAIEPSVSPDGRWLSYVNYRHERYEIVRIPYVPDGNAAAIGLANRGEAALTLPAAPLGRCDSGGRMRLDSGGRTPLDSPGGEQADPAGCKRFDSVRGGRLDSAGRVQIDAAHGERPAASAGNGVHEGAAAQERQGAGPFSPKSYKAAARIRPRVAYPFLVYEREADDPDDVSLGFGGGAGIEWTDPLRVWTAHTSAFYQHGTWWGRAAVQSGRWVVRPSMDAFRSPSTVSVLLRKEGRVDTVRVGRDERGVGVGVRTPVVLRSNVFQTHGVVSVRAEYRQERLFGTENETLRDADGRLTLNPTVQLVYRGQQNMRDLVPNSGLFLTANSKVDVWAERRSASRWLRVDGRLHIPLLQATNTGIQVQARFLAQNRGGAVALGAFLPRGYETANAFLGEGAFATYGVEVTQPLWYVDDGFLLIPLYVKAVFAYGFAESMQGIGGGSSTNRLSVAGAGLGVQLRFAHSVDFTLRLAPVFKFDAREWDWTLR